MKYFDKIIFLSWAIPLCFSSFCLLLPLFCWAIYFRLCKCGLFFLLFSFFFFFFLNKHERYIMFGFGFIFCFVLFWQKKLCYTSGKYKSNFVGKSMLSFPYFLQGIALVYALKALLQVKRKDVRLVPTIRDKNPYINS